MKYTVFICMIGMLLGNIVYVYGNAAPPKESKKEKKQVEKVEQKKAEDGQNPTEETATPATTSTESLLVNNLIVALEALPQYKNVRDNYKSKLDSLEQVIEGLESKEASHKQEKDKLNNRIKEAENNVCKSEELLSNKEADYDYLLGKYHILEQSAADFYIRYWVNVQFNKTNIENAIRTVEELKNSNIKHSDAFLEVYNKRLSILKQYEKYNTEFITVIQQFIDEGNDLEWNLNDTFISRFQSAIKATSYCTEVYGKNVPNIPYLEKHVIRPIENLDLQGKGNYYIEHFLQDLLSRLRKSE